MAALPKPNKNLQSDEENRKRFLFTRIQFNGGKNKFIIHCACLKREQLDEMVKTLGYNDSREITDSRSKELTLPEDEIISITYGGDLRAGKAIQQSTIDLKDTFQSSSLFGIHKNANYCNILYVWNKECESHRVMFSLKEEFQLMQMMVIEDDYEFTIQERKFRLSLAPSSEISVFLHYLRLKSSQFPVSRVYTSEEDAETEVVISLDPLEKVQSDDTIFSFAFFILREQRIVEVPVSFDKASGTVNGPIHTNDVFCAVAEITNEKKSLGRNGGTFTSQTDDRIQVHVPEGALDNVTEFTFKVENVDLERYRHYEEFFPNIFESLIGFPISLCIEHDMKKPLKEKAKIYLPVMKEDSDGEVLFLHWEDEQVTPLTHKEDKNFPESPYYVEVDHFSSVTGQKKRPGASVEQCIRETNIIRGHTSKCIVLSFIFPDHRQGRPTLLVDCAEGPRVKDVVKALTDEGFLEIPGTRSKDCEINEGGHVSVEIGGNLQLEVGVKKKDMKLCFSRKSLSNRLLVPVKFKNRDQPMSTVVYTANKKKWVFQVFFSLAAFLGETSSRPTSSISQQPLVKVPLPPVLSEKSLSTLGAHLPSSTWELVGIQLGLLSDTINTVLEAKTDTSTFGFRLLKLWRQNKASQPYGVLVSELTTALTETGREDIADIVRNCSNNEEYIKRKDFGDGGHQSQKQIVSSQLPPFKN